MWCGRLVVHARALVVRDIVGDLPWLELLRLHFLGQVVHDDLHLLLICVVKCMAAMMVVVVTVVMVLVRVV